MTLQNRVAPTGELLAVPARGLVYGNRGCLHSDRREIRRLFAGRRWISCRLEFRGWHRAPLMQPGRFTELFFLDEATAFAAGHRPCALCRRDDYERFLTTAGATGADELDARLHGERLDASRARRTHRREVADLADGVFVLHGGAAKVVRAGALLTWSAAGYTRREPLPAGAADVLTPPTTAAVLRGGWTGAVPLLHPSA